MCASDQLLAVSDNMNDQVSAEDIRKLHRIRQNVRDFLTSCADEYVNIPGRLLDVAPQDHEGARAYFAGGTEVLTFDIDPKAGCDYIGDLCRYNEVLAPASFDFVVCTEVLEHVRQPFFAVQEMQRILVPGGYAFVSTPFNFRIHGPLPDCWRFTEYGLRELFSDFDIVRLNALEDEARFLMPIHYTLVARKPLLSAARKHA